MAKMLDRILAQLAEGKHAPVATLLDMRIVTVEQGIVVAAMNADSRHHNPMGTLHGGILCDLADMAMGMAFFSTLDDEQSMTTLELKINYLRPVFTASLTATARVVHRGRKMGYVECDVKDEVERLIARSSSTCLILDIDQARGRSRPFQTE